MIIYDNILSTINGGGGIAVLFREIFERLSNEGISFRLLEYEKKRSCRFFERYRKCKVKNNLLADAELFHSTYYRLPDKKIPVVTTVHDFTYEKYVGGVRKLVHSAQKNYAIRNSDKIICVSKSTRDDLLEYLPNIDLSKVHVVHNGVSRMFEPLECSQSNSVLFVGQRSGYKNFDALVYALSFVHDVSLECVGGGGFSQEELFLLNRLVPGRFKHLGRLSVSDLNKAYNRSLCLVYPSLYEGFGIPVLEAMGSGCPVVATNCSSIPEVAGSAAYLMESGSPEEISAAVDFFKIEENREYYKGKGVKQSKKFSWDKTFYSTMEVYKDLIPSLS